MRYTYAQYKEKPDLATLTRKAEEEMEKLKTLGERSDKPSSSASKLGNNTTKKSGSFSPQREKGKPWCSFHQVQTHWTQDCNASQCPKCDICEKKGHSTKDHKELPIRKSEDSTSALNSASTVRILKKPYYTICNVSGHHTNNCDKKSSEGVVVRMLRVRSIYTPNKK